mgnify:CR=1
GCQLPSARHRVADFVSSIMAKAGGNRGYLSVSGQNFDDRPDFPGILAQISDLSLARSLLNDSCYR